MRGQVLLERRPSPGIWGGLWCFPKPTARTSTRLPGARLPRPLDARLDTIEHGFTHFRLTIRPMLCEVSVTAARAEMPGRLWIDIGEAGSAATPAPVRKLLETFA